MYVFQIIKRITVLSGRTLWRTIGQGRRNLSQDFLAVVLDNRRFFLGLFFNIEKINCSQALEKV